MVDEVADQGMGDEAGGRHSTLDDLRRGCLLDQALAAAAGPLAVDVPVHEELRRDDVQALAHVLPDACHRTAALRVRAVGVRRFVVMLFSAQVFGQWAATGLGFALVTGAGRRRSSAPGLVELSLQTGLVLDTGFFEEPALFGAHGLGLGPELPGLQSRQLEGDLLNLGVLEPELAVLAAQALQHLLGECCDGLGRKAFEVFFRERLQVLHASILQAPRQPRHWELRGCQRPLEPVFLQPRDRAHLVQPLPGQADHERVELRLAQCHRRCRVYLAGPHEAAGVEPSCGTPHAKAVVHKHLDARGASIGKQVAVMSMGAAQRMDHMGKQTLGARAHVYRRRTQPQGVDTDHRKTSRSHAAQSAAALTGHVTLTPKVPRLKSSVIISDVGLGGLADEAAVGGTAVGTVNSMKRGAASATPMEPKPGALGAPRPRRH